MYNNDLKEKYIQTIKSESSVNNHIRIFKKVSEFETKYNKDVYTMSKEELSEVVNELSVIRSGEDNKGYRIQCLENYIMWCVNNNIEGATENILDIAVDPNNKIRQSMIKNPSQLNIILDVLFNPVHKNTIDNIYRGAIWLIYSGINKSDINSLTSNNINFDKKEIHFNQNIYRMFEESEDSIRSCIDMTEFNVVHPLYNKNRVDVRCSGDGITRTISGELNINTLQGIISKKTIKVLDNGIVIPRIKIDKIRLSGIFYRAKLYEDLNGHVDFFSLAMSDTNGKEYNSKKNGIKGITMKKARDYMSEYRRWLDTFYK